MSVQASGELTAQAKRDQQAIEQLLQVHQENPYYGVTRLAIDLGWSEGKTRRIRNLAGVEPWKRAKKRNSHSKASKPEITAPNNALATYADFKDNNRPQDGQDYSRMTTESDAWVQDFTYIRFQNMWIYLATVLDLATRRIVGWNTSLRHNTDLVHSAAVDALSKYPSPKILHSDQGSEYLSYRLQDLCAKMEITLSCSNKASPWQNGFKERFYGTLKDELGPTSRFRDLGELQEGIALTIYYYNHKRIHTSLKTTPEAYAKRLEREEREKERKQRTKRKLEKLKPLSPKGIH